MSATYNVVTIDGHEYDVYADIATADLYLAADSSAAGAAWRAETDADTKGRHLVTATRLIDRQRWPGTKSDELQEHAFPRDGMNSECAEDGLIPQDVIDASSLLAAHLEAGVDLTGATQEQNVKQQSAGSVSIEYFRAFEEAARFPLDVQELLSCLVSGANTSPAGGVISTGTGRCSDFAHGYEPGVGF